MIHIHYTIGLLGQFLLENRRHMSNFPDMAFLKSIYLNSNLENSSNYKISSKGPIISVPLACKYAAHLMIIFKSVFLLNISNRCSDKDKISAIAVNLLLFLFNKKKTNWQLSWKFRLYRNNDLKCSKETHFRLRQK